MDLIQHEVVASLVECSPIETLLQGGTRGPQWLFQDGSHGIVLNLFDALGEHECHTLSVEQ